jgi:Flp pilus assembly pilin Flp
MRKFTFCGREEGQTMAEYGLVLTVITMACLMAFMLLGTTVVDAIKRVGLMIFLACIGWWRGEPGHHLVLR